MYSRTIAEASQNMKYVQTLRSWRYPYFGNSSTLSAEQQNNRLNSSSQTQQSDTRLGQNMDRPLTPEERASMARDRIASQGMELLGAPPDVLYLYGYSNMINDGSDTYGGVRPNGNVNLNRIPVVMSDLNITYPDDVDYLPTYSDMTGNVVDSASEPFPIKLTVSVTLLETHSPREYEKFDLRKYKQGILVNF